MEILRGMFEGGALPVVERTLAFTERRHAVLAENVANAETPGYLRRDLPLDSFREKLLSAIETRRPGEPLVPIEIRELPATSWGRSSDAGNLRHDGADVSMEVEQAALAENALLHNAMAAIARKLYGTIRAAIQGRGEGT
ncbi:MAG: hypothetical protein JXP34_20300 [Planctomycetes bacterium]|nr:hypothetical protein [Planctomycetota bacterium]